MNFEQIDFDRVELYYDSEFMGCWFPGESIVEANWVMLRTTVKTLYRAIHLFYAFWRTDDESIVDFISKVHIKVRVDDIPFEGFSQS